MIMVNLIPLPREINLSKGEFIMPKDAAVYSEIELELVKSAGGEDAPVRIYTDSSLSREEYRLKVNENGVEIKASEKQELIMRFSPCVCWADLTKAKTGYRLWKFPISLLFHGVVYTLMKAVISLALKTSSLCLMICFV